MASLFLPIKFPEYEIEDYQEDPYHFEINKHNTSQDTSFMQQEWTARLTKYQGAKFLFYTDMSYLSCAKE